MSRYKITIEYDGDGFCGWQKHPPAKNTPPSRVAKPSIEETIEIAIFNLSQETVKIIGAGRTDAGVHAFAQIAHFDLQKKISALRLKAGLNFYLLNSGVTILNCQKVKGDFHARFHAKSRHYRYAIVNRHAPLKLQKDRAWHVPEKLNLQKMRQAAAVLVGEHDFSSFRDGECQSNTPIKTIHSIKIIKKSEQILIDINANAFLHHMVRNIVGTLVKIGHDKIAVEKMVEILAAKTRSASGPNAKACGLYLLRVDY